MAGLVIFDCDGVLVDSDRISLRIQAERISALGLEMTYGNCVRDFLGLGMEATLGILAERLGRRYAGAKAAGMSALGFAATTSSARLDTADAIFTAMGDLPGLISGVA